MLGIRLPVLRKIAKEIAKDDYIAFLKSKEKYFEEIMLKGMVIGSVKENISVVLALVKEFVPKINNWSVCDSFCAGLKITKKHRAEVFGFLKQYLNGTEFEQRFVAVMLMDYFLVDEYIDEVANIYLNLNNDGYYLKMGVAWGVATIAAKYFEKAEVLLTNPVLDEKIKVLALGKIRDSYRVSAENKIKLGINAKTVCNGKSFSF